MVVRSLFSEMNGENRPPRVRDADCMHVATPARAPSQAKPHFEGKDLPADGISCGLTNGDFGTSPLYGQLSTRVRLQSERGEPAPIAQ